MNKPSFKVNTENLEKNNEYQEFSSYNKINKCSGNPGEKIQIKTPINQNQNLIENSNSENKKDNKSKNKVLFKLENVNENFNVSKEKCIEEINRKKKDKLAKNRISAKKCRQKKKAYISALENKVKNLKKELEENRNYQLNTKYSIKSFLIKTLPKKLEFLGKILYKNDQILKDKDSIDQFIKYIENNKEELINISKNYLPPSEYFLLQVYLQHIKELLNGFSEFFTDTDNLFLMNDNNYINFSDIS